MSTHFDMQRSPKHIEWKGIESEERAEYVPLG